MTDLELGAWRTLAGGPGGNLALPPHHLLTHGVVVGMTGSGKTGLLFVLVEEAIRAGIPVLMVDLKGDLPNLALCFDDLGAEPLLPWAPSTWGWIAEAPGGDDQEAGQALVRAARRA